MAKKRKKIELPSDLPAMTWDGYHWTGEFVSPAWRSFQGGDDTIRLVIEAGQQEGPTAVQGGTYRYLLDHDKPLADVIISRLMHDKPWWRDVEDDEELIEIAEEIDETGDLCGRLRLDSLFIHDVSSAGVAYVGFSFGCDWEQEHGLGVMLHRDRVAAIGGADVAILTWIARRDAEEGS